MGAEEKEASPTVLPPNSCKFSWILHKLKKIKKSVDICGVSGYNITCLKDKKRKSITTGCGSAWLERLVWDQEVAGSNPVTPIHAGVVQW